MIVDFDYINDYRKDVIAKMQTNINNNYKKSEKKLAALKRKLDNLDLESELGRKRKKEIEEKKAKIVIHEIRATGWLTNKQMYDFIRLNEQRIDIHKTILIKAFEDLEEIAITDNSKVDDIFFLLGVFKRYFQDLKNLKRSTDYLIKMIAELKAVAIDERRNNTGTYSSLLKERK